MIYRQTYNIIAKHRCRNQPFRDPEKAIADHPEDRAQHYSFSHLKPTRTPKGRTLGQAVSDKGIRKRNDWCCEKIKICNSYPNDEKKRKKEPLVSHISAICIFQNPYHRQSRDDKHQNQGRRLGNSKIIDRNERHHVCRREKKVIGRFIHQTRPDNQREAQCQKEQSSDFCDVKENKQGFY